MKNFTLGSIKTRSTRFSLVSNQNNINYRFGQQLMRPSHCIAEKKQKMKIKWFSEMLWSTKIIVKQNEMKCQMTVVVRKWTPEGSFIFLLVKPFFAPKMLTLVFFLSFSLLCFDSPNFTLNEMKRKNTQKNTHTKRNIFYDFIGFIIFEMIYYQMKSSTIIKITYLYIGLCLMLKVNLMIYNRFKSNLFGGIWLDDNQLISTFFPFCC